LKPALRCTAPSVKAADGSLRQTRSSSLEHPRS
jgi:hypothetical protein